jgi:hypothetical protein
MPSDAERVADAALSRWQAITAALTPLVGPRGVSALLKRSLYLIQGEHRCLAAVWASSDETVDLAALHTVLSQQAADTAVAAQAALLQSFVDLLSRLIGPALTERMIGSAPPSSPTGSATRNPPS